MRVTYMSCELLDHMLHLLVTGWNVHVMLAPLLPNLFGICYIDKLFDDWSHGYCWSYIIHHLHDLAMAHYIIFLSYVFGP